MNTKYIYAVVYMSTSKDAGIYLDHYATTRPTDAVVAVAARLMQQGFANPSSSYHIGKQAKVCLEHARAGLAQMLGCKPTEMLFT